MEIIAFILFLILAALWQISERVGGLSRAISGIKSPSGDLSDIAEQLEKIFRILGGTEKLRKEKEQEHEELKSRFIKLVVREGKNQKEAQANADELFEDAEFKEAHQEFSFAIDGVRKLVIEREVEERNKAKYGKFLSKAREYVSGIKEIGSWDDGMEKALNIDWEGCQWLIKKLEEEGLLKDVKAWKDEAYVHDHWEAVNSR